jgi:hypothetical protein
MPSDLNVLGLARLCEDVKKLKVTGHFLLAELVHPLFSCPTFSIIYPMF